MALNGSLLANDVTGAAVFSDFNSLPSAYLYVREGHADDKVAGPVAAAGESHGCRSRPLAEQFGHYEPRYRTWTDLEEAHKEEDSRHADVAHPGDVGLQETGTISREVGEDG